MSKNPKRFVREYPSEIKEKKSKQKDVDGEISRTILDIIRETMMGQRGNYIE